VLWADAKVRRMAKRKEIEVMNLAMVFDLVIVVCCGVEIRNKEQSLM
jgi:hypothetical protein